MADIFVSYSRKDSDRVIPMMEELRSSGYQYWMDKDGILSGEIWYTQIAKAIAECNVLLLFISGASIDSEYVQREVGLAFQIKKKIIILRLEDVQLPVTMALPLTGINWTDAWDSDWRRKITSALRRASQDPPGDMPFPAPIPRTEPFEKRSTADELFRQATVLNLQGNAERALQLYREVKVRDPYYPNIDLAIRNIEEEQKRGYMDTGGRIREDKLKEFNSGRNEYKEYRRARSLTWPITIIALLLFVVLGSGIVISRFLSLRDMTLWTFDQTTQAWQPEKQSDTKPEAAATGVRWTAPGSLQAEFAFSQVKPENLSGGMEPRATYYIDPVKGGDWSAFQTLNFEVNNASGHDLKVTFSISIGDCWYEFGEYQPLPQGQTSSLQFDLKQAQYKTCRVPERKDNPPVTFDAVWRFDIIFGTPEDPWDQVNGSVLVDNVKLTDKIPNATK